jgi:hypothetical protein
LKKARSWSPGTKCSAGTTAPSRLPAAEVKLQLSQSKVWIDKLFFDKVMLKWNIINKIKLEERVPIIYQISGKENKFNWLCFSEQTEENEFIAT